MYCLESIMSRDNQQEVECGLRDSFNVNVNCTVTRKLSHTWEVSCWCILHRAQHMPCVLKHRTSAPLGSLHPQASPAVPRQRGGKAQFLSLCSEGSSPSSVISSAFPPRVDCYCLCPERLCHIVS